MGDMVKDGSTRLKLAVLFGLLILVIGIWGCSSAKGQKLPERSEILSVMKTMGFRFDETLISTEYGTGPNQIVVSGPMGAPAKIMIEGTAADKNIVCPFQKAVLDKQDGKWTLIKLEKRPPGWFAAQRIYDVCGK